MRSTRRVKDAAEKSLKGPKTVQTNSKQTIKGELMERKMSKVIKETVQKGQASEVKEDGSNRGNKRSSLRSALQPSLVYDFQDDSPKVSNKGVKKNENKKVEAKPKPAVSKRNPKEDMAKKKGSFVTPEVILKGNSKRNGVRKKLKPLPAPNFDDVSPIVRESLKKRPTKSNIKESPFQNTRRSRSSSKSQMSQGTPSLGFEGAQTTFNDDSAIFMSPRKKLTRYSTGNKKTSTPAIAPPKNKKAIKDTKQKPQRDKILKNTSTPCDVKTIPVFTKMKVVEPEYSPVQRSDTPTSDYASMDSLVDISPSPEKPVKRTKHSPAFSLEDDYADPEPLGLNKSINKTYGNPKKKKLKTNRYSIEKVDEWASKVNSELEDVENFELSIED